MDDTIMCVYFLQLAMASFYEGDGNEDDTAPVDMVEETDPSWPPGSSTKSRSVRSMYQLIQIHYVQIYYSRASPCK